MNTTKLLKTLSSTLALAAAAAAPLQPAWGHGDAPAGDFDLQTLLAEARKATAAFRDVGAAKTAQYGEFKDAQQIACIDKAGQGGMGTHYVKLSLVQDPALDPMRPEALIYEKGENGKLELVGVEYIVDQATWDALHPEAPVLFGHPFHLVRAGNRYGLAAFYELHVWLWKHNANGLFNDWNPAVSCN
jgi:hypothetical protein